MQQRSVEHCWPLARAVAALATARDAQQVDRPSLPRGAHRGHVPDPRWVAPCETTQLLHRFRCTVEAADAAAQGRVLVRQRRWRRRKSTPIRVRSVSVVAAEVGVHQACTCASCLLQAAPLLGAAAKRHGAPSGILADRPGGGRRQLANCCWPRCPQLDEHVRGWPGHRRRRKTCKRRAGTCLGLQAADIHFWRSGISCDFAPCKKQSSCPAYTVRSFLPSNFSECGTRARDG